MTSQSGSLHFDRRGTAILQGARGVWCGEPAGTPIFRVPSRLAGTWDGRLDNGEDLQLRLGADHFDTTCDGALALAAFDRWGIEGLRLLVGEWSMAIWDPQRRTVHLARDYMGVRPLYYCVGSDALHWSANLAELVDRTGRGDALSDMFAVRFMALRMAAEITPYDEIHAVAPGACVSIDADGRTVSTRFWNLQAGRIRYADRRDYEEHLRALWRESVRGRLRTDGPVWAELSGGLDSSSVVCAADRLIARDAVPASKLHLISHATLQSPEGDERRFIAEVERHTGIRSEIVGVEDNQDHTDPDWAWLSPYALHGVGLEVIRRVRAGGGRLILSGRLGDAVMGCQPDNSVAVFDDLSCGDVAQAVRNLREWSRATRKPFIELAWRLLRPEAPTPAESGANLLALPLRDTVDDIPPITWPAGIRRSKRMLARMLLGYSHGGRLDVPHRSPDIVYSFPFSHRPLIDFMLAIPGEELSAPGATRSLMRRAFAHLVPPRILGRVSKGYYPPAAFRAARRVAASMLEMSDLEVVQRGWIDGDRLRAAMRDLIDGGGASGGDIHCVLRLERWLQARKMRSIPTRKEVKSHEVLHA